ncbi:hypothetical protein LZ30DRAFT_27089 [Colletotrichum cereale]|nr:hypothetical protein LZ30DRAFT_27089 [Colletotrichum cereale]
MQSSARRGEGRGGGPPTDSSRASILPTTSTSLYRIAQRVQIKRQREQPAQKQYRWAIISAGGRGRDTPRPCQIAKRACTEGFQGRNMSDINNLQMAGGRNADRVLLSCRPRPTAWYLSTLRCIHLGGGELPTEHERKRKIERERERDGGQLKERHPKLVVRGADN